MSKEGLSVDVLAALKREQSAKCAALIAAQKPRRETEVFWISESVCAVSATKGISAIIDAADLPKIAGLKLYANVKANGVYVQAQARGKTAMLHRLIFPGVIPKGFVVDHKDGDTLDCRQSNLRLANKSQNRANGRQKRNATASFKGITFSRKNRKWIAQICVNRHYKYLGSFASERDAADAYDTAARREFGEFAKTNSEK